MNTQNSDNTRPSGQDAAGSAKEALTPEEIGKTLGASFSVPVSNLRDPMSMLAQGLALAHRQQERVMTGGGLSFFDNPHILTADLCRYIVGLKAEEVEVSFGNTPTVGEDGTPFIRVTPVVLGFVRKALTDAVKASYYSVTKEGEQYPGSKPELFLHNTVLDPQGVPMGIVRLKAGGVTGKISVWLFPPR